MPRYSFIDSYNRFWKNRLRSSLWYCYTEAGGSRNIRNLMFTAVKSSNFNYDCSSKSCCVSEVVSVLVNEIRHTSLSWILFFLLRQLLFSRTASYRLRAECGDDARRCRCSPLGRQVLHQCLCLVNCTYPFMLRGVVFLVLHCVVRTQSRITWCP
jgi:hypothetical protein